MQQEFQRKFEESLKKQADEFERKLKRMEKLTQNKQKQEDQPRKHLPEESMGTMVSEHPQTTESVPKKAQKKQILIEPPPKKVKTEKRTEKEVLIKTDSDSEPDPVSGSCKCVHLF